MSDPALTGGLSMVESLRPAAAIVIPAVAALFAVVTDRPRLRATVAMGAAAVPFLLTMGTIPELLAGRVHVTDLGQLAPAVPFSLKLDPLGLLFGGLASGLFLLALPFSSEYVARRRTNHEPRYTACILACLAATMGIAFAGNLLVLFVFFELLTLASYPLVAHDRTETARRASYAYLAYSLTGGLLVLGGLRVVYWLAGTVTFVPGGIPELVAAAPGSTPAGIGFGLLFAGFGLRAALFPFYSWLRITREAPTPAFSLVFATIVVKAGAFGIARTVLETFGPSTTEALGVAPAALGVAGLTAVVAALMAVRQTDLVARFTYLTIAGGAYVVVGLAVLTPTAMAGALVHLFAHAVATLTVFLSIYVLRVECSARTTRDIRGVASQLPYTTAAFAVSAASLTGLPLLAGFVGMWSLLVGSAAAGSHFAVAVLLASGVLHVAAIWPLVAIAYFDTPRNPAPTDLLGRGDSTSRTDGGPSVSAAPERSRVSPPARVLVPLLAATAFLVGFGIIPGRLFVSEVAWIAVETATEASIP